MRSYLVLLALATAPPALACPTGALCAAASPGSAGARSGADAPRRLIDAPREEARAPKRTLSLRVEAVAERAPWRLDEAPPKPTTDEMPWIWQVLRREVYERMPRYRGDDELTFVLSPVVVTGSFDTVPGVGVAGDF